jgi:hypothetical protein
VAALTLLAVSVAAAASDNKLRSLPPEKQAAINAAHAPTLKQQEAALAVGATSATSAPKLDTRVGHYAGLAADIVTLRATTADLVRRDYLLLAMPAVQRQTFAAYAVALAHLAALVRGLWVDTAVAGRITDVSSNLALQANDAHVETFDNARLTVTTWNAVIVNGATASVTFTGSFAHHSTLLKAWVPETANQWKVALVRTSLTGDSGWRLAAVATMPLQQGQG